MERVCKSDWGLNVVDWISLIILIIGGLNWGCIGFFNYNVVAALFGDMTAFTRFIYMLVGLSGLWCIIGLVSHVHQHTFAAQEPPRTTTTI